MSWRKTGSNRRALRWLSITALALVGWTHALALEARPIRLGMVAVNVERTQAMWQGFLAALNAAMPRGSEPVVLQIFNNHGGLHWALLDGELDAFIEEPVLALSLAADSGARAAAMLTWHEQQFESACIVVLQANPLIELRDLAGKTIAFDSPSSTFGHALARLMLADVGLQLVEHATAGDEQPVPPKGDHVSYSYTYDHLAPLVWLFHGRSDAAALTRRQVEQVALTRPGLLRVLACSEPLPTMLFMTSAGSDWGNALASGLRDMRSSPHRDAVTLMLDDDRLPLSFKRAHQLLAGY